MSAAFVRRIPGLYLLIMSMLYAYPDFHFIGLIAICISIFVTIFHHPVVSISVGILTAMVNSFLTLAWISELSEFPSFMDGIHLFTGGFDPIWHQLLGSLSHDLARKSTCSQAKIGRITQIT